MALVPVGIRAIRARSALGVGADVDPGFLSLLLGDRCRRAGQRVTTTGRLRERHHLSDRICADECRREPVETEGDATVWRRAVAERLEQEAELALRLLARQPDHVEDALLHLTTVDTDRAATELHAVADDIVGAGQ